jgi:hypothetical protein
VKTEAGLKDEFLHILVENQSKVVRRRGFLTYVLANTVFPNNVLTLNENIKFGISQLVMPFLRSGIKNDVDAFSFIKRSSYIQGEIAFTNTLIKVTNIKNTLVIISDSEKATYTNRKGITTYITRKLADSENQSLDAAWSNGFFSFNDPGSLGILIVIPKQYISNLIMNIISIKGDSVGTSNIETNMSTLDSIKAEISLDLIKSFFAAIYTDGYRHRVNTDIACLNSILQDAGLDLLTSADTDAVASVILTKYRKKLRQFKDIDHENLIYRCLKLVLYTNYCVINPYEFYSTFVDIPYSQLQVVFNKIPRILKLGNSTQGQVYDADFSNSLLGMNTFFEDENRDALIYGLKLIRFLPYFIFNTYVVGGGNYHNQFLSIINNIKPIIPLISSFKSSHVAYNNFGSFIIDELDYIINSFYKEMNSPLKVNNKAVHLLTGLITKSFTEDLSA